jgi:dTDP-4-dehydrorhamnose reductase
VANRIVITGAGGQVGRFLAAEAGGRGHDVVPLTSAQWDITDADAAKRIVEAGDVVINCAAYTAVDAAETDGERAHAVNAVGPGNLARACALAGARLIHISTDYVFGGSFEGGPRPYEIDDATGPLNVYGKTKLAGEHAVHEALPGAHVVRTAWVYTGVGSDFVGVMRRLAAGDGPVTVVVDQIGSPTYVADLARALLQIADRPSAPPLLHVANEGAASRFEQARAVFDGVGADPDRVQPVSTEDVPRPAPRPPYSALSSSAATAAGLTPPRPWRDALAAALAEAVGTQPPGYPRRRE